MQYNEKAVLQKALDKIGTPLEMRVSIMLRITNDIKGNETLYDEIPKIGDTKWGRELLKAIHEQDQMGWEKMVRGYMSKRWRQSMEEYLSETGQLSETKSGAIWAAKIIRLLHKYCLNLWELRNSFLNGGTTKRKRLLQRDLLERKVQT